MCSNIRAIFQNCQAENLKGAKFIVIGRIWLSYGRSDSPSRVLRISGVIAAFFAGIFCTFTKKKNGNATIGLFQGMFPNNIMTFNPGWDENANALDSFEDVRQIQKELKGKGITLTQKRMKQQPDQLI